jgi:multidrug efflux pump subunit AcrA (membrane-fusion protein)
VKPADAVARRTLTLAASALAAVLLAGCGRPNASAISAAASAQPVDVTVARARFARIATPIELSGSLAAVESVTVGAATGGRVVAVDVRIGDVVRAGDRLAQVDPAGPAAEVARARAGASAAAASEAASRSTVAVASSAIAAARAELDAANDRASLAQTTAGRMERLFAQGAISRQQLDQTRGDLAGARAAVAQAQAAVAGAGHSLDAALAQAQAAGQSALGARAGVAAAAAPLRDTTVSAPFAGIVVEKFVEAGAVVAPGSPVVALQDSHDLEVDVAVPDDALAGLVPGTPLAVRIDAAGGAPVPARIRAVVPSQNAALRSATLKIAIAERRGLEPGMFARVSLPGAAHRGWIVPLDALVTRAGQSGVFAVRDGRASFVPVSTGTVGADDVELLDFHNAPMEVVVGGLERIDDGTRVAIARR